MLESDASEGYFSMDLDVVVGLGFRTPTIGSLMVYFRYEKFLLYLIVLEILSFGF